MNSFQSVILGTLQGLTEFLPVSSTAHLILLPWIIGWQDAGLSYNVALHLGSLIAILYYFRKEWHLIGKSFLGYLLSSLPKKSNTNLGYYIIAATIPTVVAGFFFESYASGIFRTPTLVASSLILFSIVMFVSDRTTKNRKDISALTTKDAIVYGLFQSLAIIPGISRSGATISGGLFVNYKRDEAARFSFLLSAPIITGAIIMELQHVSVSELLAPPLLLGIATSTITSLVAIKYLLNYVGRKNYTIFVVYRIVLGVVILVLSLR